MHMIAFKIIFILVYEKQLSGIIDYQEALCKETFCWAEAAVEHVFSKILKTMLAAPSQFLCTSAVLHPGWKHKLRNDCSQHSEFGHSHGVLEL